MRDIRHTTYEDWIEEGICLFGPDMREWKFVCPMCKHVAVSKDWVALGGKEAAGMIGFSCVGRLMDGSRDGIFGKGKGPCNYAGGGFFRLNPVRFEKDGEAHEVFEFAKEEAG